jgi:hypothetical protein
VSSKKLKEEKILIKIRIDSNVLKEPSMTRTIDVDIV